MVDTRTPEQRSRIMRSVGNKNTGPEMIVRQLLHSEGYRFSLHRRDLPGSPDIVMTKHSKIIFVHGCFWHGHGCAKGQLPKSRTCYWGQKIEANKARDRKGLAALRRSGWSVKVVWILTDVTTSFQFKQKVGKIKLASFKLRKILDIASKNSLACDAARYRHNF